MSNPYLEPVDELAGMAEGLRRLINAPAGLRAKGVLARMVIALQNIEAALAAEREHDERVARRVGDQGEGRPCHRGCYL